MENKKIDVNELIDAYKKRSSDKLKDEFLKTKINIVPYISYGMKMAFADNIVNNCCYKDGIVKIDSCKKYLLYIYALFKYWTNLDIKEESLLQQYDLLDEAGLIEKIIALIPEKEVSTFSTILEMKENDLSVNDYGTYALINKKTEMYAPKLLNIVEIFLTSLEAKIEKLDVSKIEKLVKKVIK